MFLKKKVKKQHFEKVPLCDFTRPYDITDSIQSDSPYWHSSPCSPGGQWQRPTPSFTEHKPAPQGFGSHGLREAIVAFEKEREQDMKPW